MYSYTGKKDIELVGDMTKKLFDDGLDINGRRSQGFDNGSNIAGIYNWVQAYTLQKLLLHFFK